MKRSGVIWAAAAIIGTLSLAGCSREPATARGNTRTESAGKQKPVASSSVSSLPSSDSAPSPVSPAATATPPASEQVTSAPAASETPAASPEETSGPLVAGIVELPDGSPAEGATVSLGRPDTNRMRDMILEAENPVTAVTGPDGRFRLAVETEPDNRMPLFLKVARPGYATASHTVIPKELAENLPDELKDKFPAVGAERVITLEPAAHVRGRVLDEEGRPLAGVAIAALPDVTPGPEMFTKPIYKDDAVTADDGTFVLDELAAGTYSLTADGADRVPAHRASPLPPTA